MQVVVQVTVLPFIMYVFVYICALALIASVAKMIAIAFFISVPWKVLDGVPGVARRETEESHHASTATQPHGLRQEALQAHSVSLPCW